MLITEQYREMQRQLHENPNYGMASVKYAPLVADMVRAVGATELLDYGAGKGRLGESLRQHLQGPLQMILYDPAVPEWSAPPKPAAMVACIDVLEHIEPALLDNVLDDLKRVTLRHGLFTVHTRPALKILPDGRNAHLIQQPPAWWLPKFMARFELLSFNTMPMGFWVFVERKEADPANQGALVGSGLEMLCNVVENLQVTEVVEFGGTGLSSQLMERLKKPVSVVPHVAGKRGDPGPGALVACIDVCQGWQPERVDEELDRLKLATSELAVVTIRERAAGAPSSDQGAPPEARLDTERWLAKFLDRFNLVCYSRISGGFGLVVERRRS